MRPLIHHVNLRVGIGIHHGTVVEGDVGSSEIKDCTVIGDSVNTAARVQTLSKGGETIVTQSLIDDDTMKIFSFTRMDRVKLKGKTEGVDTYAVSWKKESLPPEEMVRACITG
jgi:adenylate cyclase